MGLAARIAGLTALPFTAFLIIASIFFQTNWSRYRASISVQENSQLFIAASHLVHELQKERARSVMYVNNAGDRSELDSQRSLGNEKLTVLKKHIASSSFIPAELRKLEEVFVRLEHTRQNVESKSINGDEAAKQLTEIIAGIHGFQRAIAKATSLDGIETTFFSLTVLEAAKESTGRLRASVLAILGADKPLTADQITKISGMKAGLDANLASPALLVSDNSIKQIYDFKNLSHWKNFNETFLTVLQKSASGGYGQDQKFFYNEITHAIDDIASVMAAELAALNRKAKDIYAAAVNFLAVLSSILILSVVTLVLLGRYCIRMITGPIYSVIERLSGSSSEIGSASSQLHMAGQQLSSGTAAAAASIQETSASLEELSATVKSSAANAKNAAKISETCRSSAGTGATEMKALAEAMVEISKSSKKIEEIITVVDDIAFQTNLLALNAAVEAARAGEHGKGFAVVAEGVRSLAQRSASAAKDISTLIQESVSKIEAGKNTTDRSNKTLSEIVTSVNQVSTLNMEIDAACSEQAGGIDQITKAISQLDTAGQSNAASAEETAAAAEKMADQTAVLLESITELRLVVDGAKRNSSAADKNHGQPSSTNTVTKIEQLAA